MYVTELETRGLLVLDERRRGQESVILVRRTDDPFPFVVWRVNHRDGGSLHSGGYWRSEDDAWDDFSGRGLLG